MSGHTPGPWRWEFNATSKTIHIVGGRPTFDKTVMDFERWGMGGACPRFNSAVIGDEFNIMFRVADREDWREAFAGRDHHAHWCMDVTHPDARLIAAAPELLAALEEMLDTDPSGTPTNKATKMARTAIAKANGSAA